MHPVGLVSLGVWLVNDHLLKAWWPGHVVVGKLADGAGLVVFGLMGVALWEWLWWWRRHCEPPLVWSRAAVVACSMVGAAGLAAINLHEGAAQCYRVGLGALQWPWRAFWAWVWGQAVPWAQPVVLWMDPGDVWTLPAALVPVWLVWRGRGVGRG